MAINRIKKGDQVIVVAGKDKGKRGDAKNADNCSDSLLF